MDKPPLGEIMKAFKVTFGIKYLNNLINYLEKYSRKIPFGYLSFRKQEQQLWIIGYYFSEQVITIEKIDYSEIFKLNESCESMPDDLSFTFFKLSVFISRLNLYRDRLDKNIELEIEFEQFLDFEYKVTSLKLKDEELEVRQEIHGVILIKLQNHIERIKQLGSKFLEVFLNSSKDEIYSIIQPLSLELIESNFTNIFLNELNSYFYKQIKVSTNIVTTEKINLIVDSNDIDVRFGIKESEIRQLKKVAKLKDEKFLVIEFNSIDNNNSIMFKVKKSKLTHTSGYITNITGKTKIEFPILSILIQAIPNEDLDVHIKPNYIVFESRKADLFLAIKIEKKYFKDLLNE